MAQVNGSWIITLVPQPNGMARTKVEAFVIEHGPNNAQHSVVATGTMEFPNPEVARVLLDAFKQATGGMTRIVIPAVAISQNKN
jgi:hypothetical protein